MNKSSPWQLVVVHQLNQAMGNIWMGGTLLISWEGINRIDYGLKYKLKNATFKTCTNILTALCALWISFNRFAHSYHPLCKQNQQMAEVIHKQFVSDLQKAIQVRCSHINMFMLLYIFAKPIFASYLFFYLFLNDQD